MVEVEEQQLIEIGQAATAYIYGPRQLATLWHRPPAGGVLVAWPCSLPLKLTATELLSQHASISSSMSSTLPMPIADG